MFFKIEIIFLHNYVVVIRLSMVPMIHDMKFKVKQSLNFVNTVHVLINAPLKNNKLATDHGWRIIRAWKFSILVQVAHHLERRFVTKVWKTWPPVLSSYWAIPFNESTPLLRKIIVSLGVF